MREPGASEVLTCGLHAQARFDRLLGQQARRQQHARIGGVGATGDGRDQHVAVADGDVLHLDLGRRRLGLRRREGRLVALHFHLEALARPAASAGCRAPCGSGSSPPRRTRWRVSSSSAGWLKPFSAIGLLNSDSKLRRHLAQLDAVLRPLRAGQARRHVAQVEPHDLRVVDLARQRHTEQALRLEVGFAARRSRSSVRPVPWK